jgi:hypothetical protein
MPDCRRASLFRDFTMEIARSIRFDDLATRERTDRPGVGTTRSVARQLFPRKNISI